MIIIFHTAELGKYIGWNELQRIKHNCKKYRDKNGNIVPNRWIFDKYSDNGLIFIYEDPPRTSNKKYRFPWMKVLVNFSKLLRTDEHIVLPEYFEVQDVIHLYRAYMEVACMEQRALPFIPKDEDYPERQCNTIELFVQRVDCTAQLTGLSQKTIDAYIHIYNHSNRKQFPRARPRGYKNYDLQKNYPRHNRQGSAYFASKNIGVNIYDKHRQMENINEQLKEKGKSPKYSDADVAAAQGILRIEFQCYKQSLPYRLYKNKETGFTSKTLENVIDSRISEDIILSNLKKLTWSWDVPHRNVRKTIQAIKDSKSKSKTKTRLIEIINANKPKGMSIDKVVGCISTPDKFEDDLRKIKNLGVHPITLPVNKAPDELRNLYCIIAEQMEKMKEVFVCDSEELHEETAPSGDMSIFDEYEPEELEESES